MHTDKKKRYKKELNESSIKIEEVIEGEKKINKQHS